MDDIDLVDTERKLSVGAGLVHVDLNGVRAVHRLKSIGVVIILARDYEHAVLIMCPVS